MSKKNGNLPRLKILVLYSLLMSVTIFVTLSERVTYFFVTEVISNIINEVEFTYIIIIKIILSSLITEAFKCLKQKLKNYIDCG